jgi:hypothetical protein
MTWQPSPKDIDLVMNELRPLMREVPDAGATREEAEVECREWITSALVDIHSPRKFAGQMKDRLGEIAETWIKACKAASDLPVDVMRRLGLDKELLAELDRIARVSGQWSDQIVARKTSYTVVKGEHTRMAASRAFSLFVVFTDRRPTSSNDGDYIRITELMHKLAIGKKRSAAHACGEVIREVKAWPDSLGEPDPPWERVGPPRQ